MKKIILSIAVVAFLAVGAISVSATENTQTQDPPKKVEVKKEATVTTKTAETKECAPAEKKSCCETAKTCDPKKMAKKKIK